MAEARELYFLRHADAGDAERWHGDDAARPLSAKGVAQAQRLAAFLANIRFAVDAIVSSPKLRATQTAQVMAATVGTVVTVDDRLGGGFTVETLATLVAEMADARTVLLVGHDPDFSSIVSALCGAKGIRLRTCTLARVDVDDPPAPGHSALRWLIPPDALEAPTPG